MTSSSVVVGFRASGELLAYLQSECFEDLNESIGETARRLLNRNISQSAANSVNSVNSVNTQSSDSDLILSRLSEIEDRLLKLEQPTHPDFSVGAKQLTIFDALEEVEQSLKSSGVLADFSLEAEENYLLQEDLDKARADYDALLESSNRIITELRSEVQKLRSQLETERGYLNEVDVQLQEVRSQLETERSAWEEKLNQSEFELIQAKSKLTFPDSVEILNTLKSNAKRRRKACNVTFTDIEAIFKLVGT